MDPVTGGKTLEASNTPQDPEAQRPDQGPTQNPVDDNAVDTTVDSDEEPFSTRLIAAADNLSPSEVVPPDKVGAVLGALLLAHDNDGDVPAPLHERFDNVPNPNPES